MKHFPATQRNIIPFMYAFVNTEPSTTTPITTSTTTTTPGTSSEGTHSSIPFYLCVSASILVRTDGIVKPNFTMCVLAWLPGRVISTQFKGGMIWKIYEETTVILSNGNDKREEGYSTSTWNSLLMVHAPYVGKIFATFKTYNQLSQTDLSYSPRTKKCIQIH